MALVVGSAEIFRPRSSLNSSHKKKTRSSAPNDCFLVSQPAFYNSGRVVASRAAALMEPRAAVGSSTSTLRCSLTGWGIFGGPPAHTSLRTKAMYAVVGALDVDGEANKNLPPLPDKRVLAGVGTVTLDFLARVGSFPVPDTKLRSLDSLAQGGGNVGNALTAAARLGLSPRIFSKVANDASGIGILAELESDGVDVSHIVGAIPVHTYYFPRHSEGSAVELFNMKGPEGVTEDGVSPFTYVLVDEKKKTRTCIHTPGHPPLDIARVQPLAASFLERADLLYLDSRLPDAALLILEEARKRQVPVILDAERKRERLDEMIHLVDYLVTSATFPQVWTEAPTLAEAMISLAVQLPHLKFVIVTQGSAGCVMFERSSAETSDVLDPESTLVTLQREADQHQNSSPEVFSSEIGLLRASRSEKTSGKHVVGRFLVGTAFFLHEAEVLDTTGAGDAFIGGITYGILAGFSAEKMLRLGAVLGAANCRELGARTGLPHRADPRVLQLLS